MKLIWIHMKIKAEFDISTLFIGNSYSCTRENGHQILELKFTDKVISSDLNEVFEEERKIEARLMAYSVLHNKKCIIVDHKELVEDDKGLPHEMLWGKNSYGEDFINQNEWVNANGDVFWIIDLADKDFERFSSNLNKLLVTEPILRFVLKKFNSAYFDQDYEFFNLYDIKEGVKKYFLEIGIDEYIQELRLLPKEIGEFTHTLNNKPFFQSRHPGKFVGEMQVADGNLVRELRKTARKMILALMAYLLKKNGMAYYGLVEKE